MNGKFIISDDFFPIMRYCFAYVESKTDRETSKTHESLASRDGRLYWGGQSAHHFTVGNWGFSSRWPRHALPSPSRQSFRPRAAQNNKAPSKNRNPRKIEISSLTHNAIRQIREKIWPRLTGPTSKSSRNGHPLTQAILFHGQNSGRSLGFWRESSLMLSYWTSEIASSRNVKKKRG